MFQIVQNFRLHNALNKGDQSVRSRAAVLEVDANVGSACRYDADHFASHPVVEPGTHDRAGDTWLLVQLA